MKENKDVFIGLGLVRELATLLAFEFYEGEFNGAFQSQTKDFSKRHSCPIESMCMARENWEKWKGIAVRFLGKIGPVVL